MIIILCIDSVEEVVNLFEVELQKPRNLNSLESEDRGHGETVGVYTTQLQSDTVQSCGHGKAGTRPRGVGLLKKPKDLSPSEREEHYIMLLLTTYNATNIMLLLTTHKAANMMILRQRTHSSILMVSESLFPIRSHRKCTPKVRLRQFQSVLVEPSCGLAGVSGSVSIFIEGNW